MFGIRLLVTSPLIVLEIVVELSVILTCLLIVVVLTVALTAFSVVLLEIIKPM